MPSSPESETSAGHGGRAGVGQPAPEPGGSERPVAEPRGPEPADGQSPPDVSELRAELARTEDRYKRALADLENYRKRAAQETQRGVAEARESVLRDWLDAVDSVERALRIQSDGPCAEGLGAVLEQMNAVLAREGAQRVGAPGETFDPLRHEAIAVHPSADVPDRTILAVERSGFAVGDRLIRPAQVVVARAPEHAR
jgi:molecular chaperone GrpE